MLRTNFRRTLIELVLVAAPAAALAGCGDRGSTPDAFEGGNNFCSPSTLVKVEPEPPSPALLDLVRACEADTRRCEDLCWRILYDEGLPSVSLQSCSVAHAATDHTITVEYCYLVAEGRRPVGLTRTRAHCADPASGHLARAAYFEAASVQAFVQLARELRRHRAPRRLVSAARRAAVEEIHHGRTMARLARERGAVPPPVVVVTPRRQSIETIAIANAREGLVGETWSAMLALWQARNAPDPALRAIYARIADDELRHAELAVEIDRWARTRLPRAARARVEDARGRALARLARQVRQDPDRALVTELGLPDRTAMTRMFGHAREKLWS